MKLTGKTVIIIPHSTIFFKLAKLFIVNSNISRSEFLVVAEKGNFNKIRFRKRVSKVGLITATDELLFSRYEAFFNHWQKAEVKFLSIVNIDNFKPDLVINTINNNDINDELILFRGDNLISMGSGYIPKKVLALYKNKLNIHPGILPKYKGIGTPEAIMKGDYKNCGWTIHELISKIDFGNILYIKKVDYQLLHKMNFADIYIFLYLNFVESFFKDDLIINQPLHQDSNKKYKSLIKFSTFIFSKVLIKQPITTYSQH